MTTDDQTKLRDSQVKLRDSIVKCLNDAIDELGLLALDDGTEVPKDTLLPYCKDALRITLSSIADFVSVVEVPSEEPPTDPETGEVADLEVFLYHKDIAQLIRDIAEVL